MKIWHGLLIAALVIRFVHPAWLKWSLLAAFALFFGIGG